MKPLSLAVVGHTNTGKTSLLRTLLRDSTFGEVKNAPATTRHVEQAAIGNSNETFVYLYDTPGLEDAGGVLDWLEAHTSSRSDGVERIQQFLNSPEAEGDFNQEAKVLRQLLQSDMALYVVDAREPVLEKYKDELTVLSWCAKPVMPVFNFMNDADLSSWTTMLARRNLHVSCGFDTVAFDFEGEIRLWDNLATMLPQRQTLDKLIDMRRQEWQTLDQDARMDIAYFLLDVAAYRLEIDEDESPAPTLATMQEAVRQLERSLQQQLFQHYRFYQNNIDSADWVLKGFRQNPFDRELLTEYGIRTTTGVATGALIGMGVDMLTLGGSLGLGTAIGSVLGGVLPNMQTLSDKWNGRQTLFIDADTLTLMAARALDLLHTLQTRGHAAQHAIEMQHTSAPWQPTHMPNILQKARQNTDWSSLNTGRPEYSHQLSHEAAITLSTHLV